MTQFEGMNFGAGSKRSRAVRLATMASAMAGGAALLSGCGEEPKKPVAIADKNAGKSQVEVYENVFECVKKTGMSQEQCMSAREDAVAAAAATAPRFAAIQDCEGDFGAGGCVEAKSEGRSYFSPFVTAFVLGRMMGTSRESMPLFRRPGESGFTTANGARLGYGGSPGKYYAAARALDKPASTPRIKSASKLASAGGLTQRSTGFLIAGRMTDTDSDSSKSSKSKSKGG